MVGERGSIRLDAKLLRRARPRVLRLLAGDGADFGAEPRPFDAFAPGSSSGADELGAHVIAQERTAAYLEQLAATDWSDEALDRRVASGEVSPQHAENVKAELPSPRDVWVAPTEIVFRDGLDLRWRSTRTGAARRRRPRR